VDDGSTDGTRDWLSATSIPMLRLFNEHNLGSYGSLNHALAHSKGDLIAVLNDDDVWLPNKLARQVEAMDSNPRVGLVSTGGVFIDHASKPMADPRPLGFAYPRLPDGDALPALIEFNKVINSAALVRREAIEAAGGWNPGFYGCGDWHLWLQVAQKWEGRFIDEPLTLYRVHPHQASRNESKMNDDSRRIREWIATWDAAQYASRPGVTEALAQNWAALGTERMWAGEPKGAREAFRQSLCIRPQRWKTRLRLAATYLGEPAFKALR
jgi:glycosyltransferase involved in cell wall biosynthesis